MNNIKEILDFKEDADYKKLSVDEIIDLKNYITNLQEEIEKLNNIIEEFEKYLEQQYLEWKDDYNDEIVAMANEDKAVLNKIKELKEGK